MRLEPTPGIAGKMESKAVVCRNTSGSLAVERIVVEAPREREVLVKLAACGVCHSDLSVADGTIPMPRPIILGHEGAGVIIGTGTGVEGLGIGDHVVSSFVSVCGHCSYCRRGKHSLCDQAARAIATLPDGTVRTRDGNGDSLNVFCGCGVMSEYATLHVDSVVKIDKSVPLDRAALVGCSVVTGFGAVMNTAQVEPGSVVVVFGAGGVGLNVIQSAALAAASRIVVVDVAAEKLEFARQFGATDLVNAREQSELVKAIKRLTGGGADYSFECVGRGETISQAYGVLRKGGTAVVVGVSSPKDSATIAPMSLTLEERTLTGSYFGSANPQKDFGRVLDLYKAKRLKLDELITRTYSIDDAPQAFADLAAGRNARGIIVF
jgi:S-(hydroxymethyl)glutathione dehydrogenase/alcohol dehydrogenase